MIYRIVCKEEVSTEFFVEAEDRVDLWDWINGELKGMQGDTTAADVVSNLTDRQTVHDREFEVYESWLKHPPAADFDVTKALKRGDSDCAEKS